MPSYNPPKKNTAFVMYLSLRSQADVRLFQVNPTLAAGDVKVSKDGGALANVTTLPTVVSSTALVKLELSSTEMNADNVTVIFTDAAGGQWCDLVINLQTAAGQFDDIAAIKAKTDALPASPAAVGSAMTLATNAVNAAAVATDAVTEIQNGLATSSMLSTVVGYIDTEVAAILAAVDTEIAAIKAKTDALPSDPADQSAVEAAITAAVAGLNDLSAADVKSEVVDALSVDTYAELSSVPAATASLVEKVNWLYMLARNKRVTSGTQDKVRNDADSADVGTAALSDDGTNFTRGEYS